MGGIELFHATGKVSHGRLNQTGAVEMGIAFRDGYGKDRLLMGCTGHGHCPLVHLHELLRQMQTDTRSLDIILITRKEFVKNRSDVLRWNANTIVLYRHTYLLIILLQMDADASPFRCELKGIGQQIDQDFLHLVRIHPQFYPIHVGLQFILDPFATS